jgi:hypothetical protein
MAFGTSVGSAAVWRRQSVAAVLLLIGVGIGLLMPLLRQSVSAAFSGSSSRYTGIVSQDVTGDSAGGGLVLSEVQNTGRDMPQLVAVAPGRHIIPTRFEGMIGHHPIELHSLELGHGGIAWDLGPLAHGQTATLLMWFTSTTRDTSAQLGFYANIPRLGRLPDLQDHIWRP